MATIIPNIEFPELFFGFVSAIGADLRPAISAFRKYLEAQHYNVVEIRVTDVFKKLQSTVKPKAPLDENTEHKRYNTYISYGTHLREKTGDDAILAVFTIWNILNERAKIKSGKTYSKTAFLLYQFKRKEEIDLLRSVYDRLFFQVSVYSRRGARVATLAQKFAKSENSADTNNYRAAAEALVQTDERELDSDHGQSVGKIFHDADFIINSDVNTPTVESQVERFCELIFSNNGLSPTKFEYGMFLAKAAALRTTDLSRQVGAAVFSPRGEIICLGSNEVPKATGGTYWADESFDDREFRRGYDSNDKRKLELLRDLVTAIDSSKDADKLLKSKKVADSQFMDALEYGRIVHAEMSAITDAARLGRSTVNATLYCTTFPCHMCAKHIVAAGISNVVFLEPYPKSLAADLHSDSIDIEGAERGKYADFPAVKFEHFFGVTPRRYRELFERSKRKNSDGKFLTYKHDPKKPYIEIKTPVYPVYEINIIKESYVSNFNLEMLASLSDTSPSISRKKTAPKTRKKSGARRKR